MGFLDKLDKLLEGAAIGLVKRELVKRGVPVDEKKPRRRRRAPRQVKKGRVVSQGDVVLEGKVVSSKDE